MINMLNIETITKQRVILIGILRGACMYDALALFNFAESKHNGMRKDGITPEFAHQIQIALYLTTLNLERSNLAISIIAALAHDLFEDIEGLTIQSVVETCGYDFSNDNPQKNKVSLNLEQGLSVAMTLSKIRNGVKIPFDQYMNELALSPIGALCKGADRINNFQSMCGVFSIEKQKKYLEEGMLILKCIKQARKNFPEFANSFLNIEYMLKSQIELISIMLDIHPTRTNTLDELPAYSEPGLIEGIEPDLDSRVEPSYGITWGMRKKSCESEARLAFGARRYTVKNNPFKEGTWSNKWWHDEFVFLSNQILSN
jgi:hypothetical protein